MNINKLTIPVTLSGNDFEVSVKWFRGASRYNNGATKYGKKYNLRYFLHNASDRKRKQQNEA